MGIEGVTISCMRGPGMELLGIGPPNYKDTHDKSALNIAKQCLGSQRRRISVDTPINAK